MLPEEQAIDETSADKEGSEPSSEPLAGEGDDTVTESPFVETDGQEATQETTETTTQTTEEEAQLDDKSGTTGEGEPITEESTLT